MNQTILDQLGMVAALLFSFARASSFLKPVWGWLPSKFQWVPPLLAIALPQIAEAVQGAKTKEQLIQAGLLAFALLAPGIRSAVHKEAVGDGPKPPTGGAGAAVGAMALLFILCFAPIACAGAPLTAEQRAPYEAAALRLSCRELSEPGRTMPPALVEVCAVVLNLDKKPEATDGGAAAAP